MKYEGRKTHKRDKLYVRDGRGLYPIVKVKIEEGVIDKKDAKYRGVKPKNTGEGEGRDQMQNHEENV